MFEVFSVSANVKTTLPDTSDAFVTSNVNCPPVPGAIKPFFTSVSPVVVFSSLIVSNKFALNEAAVVPPPTTSSVPTFHAHFATVAVEVPETVLVYFAHVPDTKVRLKMATNTVIIPNNKTLFFFHFLSPYIYLLILFICIVTRVAAVIP